MQSILKEIVLTNIINNNNQFDAYQLIINYNYQFTHNISDLIVDELLDKIRQDLFVLKHSHFNIINYHNFKNRYKILKNEKIYNYKKINILMFDCAIEIITYRILKSIENRKDAFS
jgi:hypothetical protein